MALNSKIVCKMATNNSDNSNAIKPNGQVLTFQTVHVTMKNLCLPRRSLTVHARQICKRCRDKHSSEFY